MEILSVITPDLMAFFVMGLLGMIVHFITKFEKGPGNGLDLSDTGRIKACWNYFFKVDILNTIKAFIGYIFLFGALYSLGSISMETAIMAGYTCDSAFNKAKSGKI